MNIMKLARAGPVFRQAMALAVLALVSSAALYAGLAAHARAWRWSREDQDRIILEKFQRKFVQCVGEKAMGLDAIPVNECRVKLVFTDESAAMWRDPITGELEGLVYEFDLCRMITLWAQVRNSTTILTKEYIDGLPNGWRDYAWKRINKGHSKTCSWNVTQCKEKLAVVVPSRAPFTPGQHRRCAVVGNSGDLLQDLFGAEIDAHDAVIRMNGAPVQNYIHYVGEKTTFRILNRGSAKALDKVAMLGAFAKEILIIKTTIHDITSQMIREIPIRNPVYLMLGAPLGQGSAKGTGIKAIELALSVCELVDIYGYTVDPGYLECFPCHLRHPGLRNADFDNSQWKKRGSPSQTLGGYGIPGACFWARLSQLATLLLRTRYFSEARKGHAPLQGRAYYQAMECLGLIRIHSPQRRVSASTQRDVKLNSMLRNAAAAHLSMPKK